MGPGERSPQGVIAYGLGDDAAGRRARWVAVVGAVAGLAPIVLAVELLGRMAFRPPRAVWAIFFAAGVLVLVRAVVQAGAARRRLRALRVTIDEAAITAASWREVHRVERDRVARIVEVDGALGGIRVESLPDPRTFAVTVASLPRGGPGYGEARARLERWRSIDRRGRRGPLVRLALGAAVVVSMFVLPFVLEDFVARSPAAAAVIVVLAWLTMRVALRGR